MLFEQCIKSGAEFALGFETPDTYLVIAATWSWRVDVETPFREKWNRIRKHVLRVQCTHDSHFVVKGDCKFQRVVFDKLV